MAAKNECPISAGTSPLLSSLGVEPRLLIDPTEAAAAIDALLVAAGRDGVIGADIETTPLASSANPRAEISLKQAADIDSALDPYRAEVRVLSLWHPDASNALVVDLRRVPLSELPAKLWEARLVFHNATFDTKHLLHAGAPLKPAQLLCSMLAVGFVTRGELNARREGNRRPSLAVAAKELFGFDVDKEGQTADWSVANLDQALVDYAALDAVLARRLLTAAEQRMGADACHAFRVACSCIHAVARMELAGLPFDTEIHRATALGWETSLEAAKEKAKELTGIENPRSPPQVAGWLKGILPSNVLREWPRTKSGNLSIEGKVLRAFAHHHLGIEVISDHSKLSTLNSTFGLPLLDKVSPVTGRLHTSLQIAQAKSGRFSSKNPNLQNLPREKLVRGAVRAPAGSVLLVADYNQIELRVMAEVAGDERMRNAYASGLDLHAVTASTMLGIALNQFDKKRPEHTAARQKAKGVNFGIIYGCGEKGLVAFARDSYGIIMTEREARAMINTWLRSYPGVANWQRRQVARCRSSGLVHTPAGRTYRFAWEQDGKFSRNLALNLPVQGGAAEVAQIALAMIDAMLSEKLGERARLVGQVHDEFLVLADRPVANRAKTLLVKGMTEAFSELYPEAPVRDLVDAKIIASWADAK